MNGDCSKKQLDWWQRREIERALASELNCKLEAMRMAAVRLNEACESIGQGEVSPDSGLVVRRAGNEVSLAFKDYNEALARWKRFVLQGELPEI